MSNVVSIFTRKPVTDGDSFTRITPRMACSCESQLFYLTSDGPDVQCARCGAVYPGLETTDE